MKILHTSDWHLGASLGTQKRYEETEKILAWLCETLKNEDVRALLIAGDIFDTGLPPNQATELYYRFLAKLQTTNVKNIIVVAGNHDSATYMDAPAEVLKHLNVRVFGKTTPENPERHLVPLKNDDGSIAAIIAAIPYPRDRDIRQAISGEGVAEQLKNRLDCIVSLYQNICSRAAELYPGKPLIATGHLYISGGRVSLDKEIGTLNGISLAALPENIDYLALGHLHIPQKIDGKINCYYSGSLLDMNFTDDPSHKKVLLLESSSLKEPPKELEIPCFQKMEKISGDLEYIFTRLDELIAQKESVWLHVENSGDFEPSLQYKLSEKCKDTALLLISCNNLRPNPAVLKLKPASAQKLDELTPEQVFERLLNQQEYSKEVKASLLTAFQTAINELKDEDTNAH